MADPAYTNVELMTLAGPEYRRVLAAATRPATADEIPVIDLDGMWFYDAATAAGDAVAAEAAKARIAAAIRTAATGAGFFYVTNHGIPSAVVAAARHHATRFFALPLAEKMRVHAQQDPQGNGYAPVYSGHINRSETKDLKEAFNFRYQPQYDPLHAAAAATSEAAFAPALSQGSEWTWEQTRHLPGFKEATLAWWQHCLQLARGLVRLFALALDLPEDYFDAVTTHPGSDGLYICYPGTAVAAAAGDSSGAAAAADVGIGSHTDMQCFTLLWQDESGGLEVLLPRRQGGSNGGSDGDGDGDGGPPYEWVAATPRPDTLVVNIADFLQRLSNDRFRSTVHRVYNRQAAPRFSMPFFFGFNADAECAVVPTCVDAGRPPRYAPITCGKWRDERMALARVGGKTNTARAPVEAGS